jgi:hypothetical protein
MVHADPITLTLNAYGLVRIVAQPASPADHAGEVVWTQPTGSMIDT